MTNPIYFSNTSPVANLSALYCATALPFDTFYFKDSTTGEEFEFERRTHLYAADKFKKAHRIPAKVQHYIALLEHIVEIYGVGAVERLEMQSWTLSWLHSQANYKSAVPAYVQQRDKRIALAQACGGSMQQDRTVQVQELDYLTYPELEQSCFSGTRAVIERVLSLKNKIRLLRAQAQYIAAGMHLFAEAKNIEKILDDAFMHTTFYKQMQGLWQLAHHPVNKPLLSLSYLKDVNTAQYFWTNEYLGIALKAHPTKPDTLVVIQSSKNCGFEESLEELADELTHWFTTNDVKGPQGNALKVIFM